MIAMPKTGQMLQAMTFEAKNFSRLRSGGNFELYASIHCFDFDFVSKRRLGKRNFGFRVNIIVFSLKSFVGGDMDIHIEIARRSAAHARRRGGAVAR